MPKKETSKEILEKKSKEIAINEENISIKKEKETSKAIQSNSKKETSPKLEKEIKKIVDNAINKKATMEKNKIDEETVIEKIKNFIAKIAEMQEEARKRAIWQKRK